MPFTEPPAPGAAGVSRPALADDGSQALAQALYALTERYEVLRELGRGGMAVVYHARERRGPDGVLGREVAIKLLDRRFGADDETVRRFEREARTVAELDHPNVVRTLATETLPSGALAIVTAYVHGQTLREALRAEPGPWPFERAAAVLRDVAAALAYAHGRRIVHRDVKPENVFLDEATGSALLADFGIARPLDTDVQMTVAGAALGTPAYMAPEQIVGGAVDERTDVYALGLVGWELLAGRRPWQGETLYAVLHKQQHEPLPDPAEVRPDVPAYLASAVRGALAKDAAGRWRDGSAFLERLTVAPLPLPALVEGPPDGDGATGRAERAQHAAVLLSPPRAGRSGRRVRAQQRGRGRVVGAVVGGAVAALLAGGVVLSRRPADAPDVTPNEAPAVDQQLDSLLRAGAVATGAATTGAAATDASSRRRAAPSAVPTAPATAPPPPARAASPRSTPAPTPAPSSAPTSVATSSRAPGGARSVDARGTEAPATLVAAGEVAADTATLGREAVDDSTAADPQCASATSADQRACLMAAIDRADVPLNLDYQELIAELRRRAGGEREPPPVESLRVEQRAWVAARDRVCRAELAGREGTLWGRARAPCFATRSGRRAAELRTRLARLTEETP